MKPVGHISRKELFHYFMKNKTNERTGEEAPRKKITDDEAFVQQHRPQIYKTSATPQNETLEFAHTKKVLNAVQSRKPVEIQPLTSAVDASMELYCWIIHLKCSFCVRVFGFFLSSSISLHLTSLFMLHIKNKSAANCVRY